MMKTPKEFDYDLWITKDGKCMARVKATGEVTEVSRTVMRLLRAEEKKLRREMEASQEGTSDLSLDAICIDEEVETPAWLIDKSCDVGAEVLAKGMQEDFVKMLTPKQEEVFKICMSGEMPIREYAREKGLAHVTVIETVEAIRKKFKKYFS